MATSMGRGAAAGAPFQFELHSPDFAVPADTVSYVREKVASRLAKFGRHVIAVLVRLKDDNGPKGGEAIVCRMEALLAGLEPTNVLERDHDLRAALDRAMDRLELGVQRHLDRRDSRILNRGRKIVRNNKLTP